MHDIQRSYCIRKLKTHIIIDFQVAMYHQQIRQQYAQQAAQQNRLYAPKVETNLNVPNSGNKIGPHKHYEAMPTTTPPPPAPVTIPCFSLLIMPDRT